MNFHIITLFPNLFDSYLADSIMGRAIEGKKIKVKFYNPREFTTDKHHKTDDRPYGGGPGMVMYAEPILRAVEKIKKVKSTKQTRRWRIILFSPGGTMLTNTYARACVKKYTDVILICGRYEGIDSRVERILKAELISIGDYVVTGGELPAMIMIDTIARQIPGVLGKHESLEEERVSSHEMYTRPETLVWKKKKYKVPAVLTSGDHKAIEVWKKNLAK